MNLRRYDHPASRVAVCLKDGRALKESITSQRGDFQNPVTRDELIGKFRFLVWETLGEERTPGTFHSHVCPHPAPDFIGVIPLPVGEGPRVRVH